jgi:hypothetical protein
MSDTFLQVTSFDPLVVSEPQGPQGPQGQPGPAGPPGINGVDSVDGQTGVVSLAALPSVSGKADKSANLSDLADPAAALANLAGVGKDIVVLRSLDHGVKSDGTTDDSTALNALISSVLSNYATGKLYVIDLPIGTTKCNSPLPNLDPTRVRLRGLGTTATILDMTGCTTGPLATIQTPVANTGAHQIGPLQSLTLKAPQSRSTTVDAVTLGGGGYYASLVMHIDLCIDGGQNQVIFGTNVYLNRFMHCLFNHARLNSVNFTGAAGNSGENEVFVNCVFSNGENGLLLAPTSTAAKFTFIGCSFDFMDRAWTRSGLGGSIDTYGCHFEGNYRTVTVTLTSGSTTATATGSPWVSGIDNGKRIADTSGANTYLAANTTFTVVDANTITLSAAANASGTVSVKVASSFYLNSDVSGIVADHGTTIFGGELYPSWDGDVRTGFLGITGTTAQQSGQARTLIDGLTIDVGLSSTAKYLVYDSSILGGNGIQSKAPNTLSVRGVSYIGAPATSYKTYWPLRYRDRAGVEYILSGDFDSVAVGVKSVYGPNFLPGGFWQTMPRDHAKDKLALASGTLYLTRLPMEDAGWVQNVAATMRWYYEIGAAATGQTSFSVGLYYASTTGPSGPVSSTTLAAISSTGNQAPAANAVSKVFTSMTSNVSPFSEIWIGVLFTGTTGPEMYGRLHATARPGLLHADFPMVAAKLTGQSSLPGSITKSSLVASEFQPWVALNPTQS